MEKLDITTIKSGDDGFVAIASCARNVNDLAIGNENDPKVTKTGIRVLAEEILKRDAPVSYLEHFSRVYHVVKTNLRYLSTTSYLDSPST